MTMLFCHQAFEWIVLDVSRLQQFVEGPSPSDGAEKDTFEILREGPILGDQKFKLEIGMFPIKYVDQIIDGLCYSSNYSSRRV